MEETLNYDGFVRMLVAGAERVEAEQARLSELDSHGGDGDHGTTMVRAMSGLRKTVEETDGGGLEKLLYDVGWAIMGVDGGAAGPLFGALFMGMSDGLPEDGILNGLGLVGTFKAGFLNVERQTKAKVGDKTLMDALVPAVDAMEAAACDGAGLSVIFAAAAEAAKKGAESTANLQARFGRAKNVGEGSLGFEDPGATSVALLFQGFREELEARTRNHEI